MPPPVGGAATSMRKHVQEKGQLLIKYLDAVGILADEIFYNPDVQITSADASLEGGLRRRRRKPDQAEEARLEREAAAGVVLHINRLPTRKTEVSVDGKAPVHLSPALGDLVEILAADRGYTPAGDPLVGWKREADILLQLDELKRGQGPPDEAVSQSPLGVGGTEAPEAPRMTLHALEQGLSRLRQALKDNGWNPKLVQRHPQFGLRFARRRKPML